MALANFDYTYDEERSPVSVFVAGKKEHALRGRFWDGFIDSTKGRPDGITFCKDMGINAGISKYNNAQCEYLYNLFSKGGDVVFDPFAGGSVRGVIAALKGRQYFGFDVRLEQLEENISQYSAIDHVLKIGKFEPIYFHDSSENMGEYTANESVDFIQTSPPYFDVEIYSSQPDDLSNLKSYDEFLVRYEKILQACFDALKLNKFCVFTVGNFRDGRGDMVDFVGDTIRIAEKAGFHFYNEMILVTNCFAKTYHANLFQKSKKIIKNHQNILIFRK
jgi:DNA modification methylase